MNQLNQFAVVHRRSRTGPGRPELTQTITAVSAVLAVAIGSTVLLDVTKTTDAIAATARATPGNAEVDEP